MSIDSPVIFLDVDGVLNSHETASEYHRVYEKNGFGGFFNDDKDEPTYENVLWGPDLVERLRTIVERTGAVIVISSTWRITHRVHTFPKMFAVYGWDGAPVVGATDRDGPHRGNEIQRFIDRYGVKSYVILDDSTDMLESQMDNFVRTDEAVGLSLDNVEWAVAILNRKVTHG